MWYTEQINIDSKCNSEEDDEDSLQVAVVGQQIKALVHQS